MSKFKSSLQTVEDQRLFEENFNTMDQIVQRQNYSNNKAPVNPFLPLFPSLPDVLPLEDLRLYYQQQELSTILETAIDYQQAQTLLQNSSLANLEWQMEKWEPIMLETAMEIAQKWKNGFNSKGQK